MVLSSSLHGVIVANAYGVPARYFQVAGTPLMGREGLKFADYFKSVRMPVQKPLMFTNGSIIDAALSKHVDQTVDLKIDLELLQDVFPWDMI